MGRPKNVTDFRARLCRQVSAQNEGSNWGEKTVGVAENRATLSAGPAQPRPDAEPVEPGWTGTLPGDERSRARCRRRAFSYGHCSPAPAHLPKNLQKKCGQTGAPPLVKQRPVLARKPRHRLRNIGAGGCARWASRRIGPGLPRQKKRQGDSGKHARRAKYPTA